MPKRDNSLLIQDIYEAGNKIIRFTSGYSYDEYLDDERTMDAVIRNFEVIGEASGLLSKEFKEQNPHVEWRKMIGFRNLLIHEYFGINQRLLWETIQSYLPQTLKAIKQFLPEQD